MRARWVAAASLLCLSGCDSAPRQEPVVIYVAGDENSSLASRLGAFTDATGIPVTLRFGSSGANTDAVIENRGSPPADLLLTDNVADIWRAADQGALRPIASAALKDMPEYLRDPDAMWIALNVHIAVIVKQSDDAAQNPGRYVDLAEPQYEGTLCLTSSALSMNRALIAMMIDERGRRPTELVVRQWMQNLALPPFESEERLVDAIRSGACRYSILSNAHATGLEVSVPDGAYFDTDSIGIARHARYPESAQKLLHWLLENPTMDVPDAVSRRNIGIAGWRDEEAVLLAERAAYR